MGNCSFLLQNYLQVLLIANHCHGKQGSLGALQEGCSLIDMHSVCNLSLWSKVSPVVMTVLFLNNTGKRQGWGGGGGRGDEKKEKENNEDDYSTTEILIFSKASCIVVQ